MVVYPDEWDNYLIPWKNRVFRKDTPADIIKKAKEINKSYSRFSDKDFFHFEEERSDISTDEN